MPGVFGFYLKDRGNLLDPVRLLDSMAESLRHLDTYYCDRKVIGNCGLGTVHFDHSMQDGILGPLDGVTVAASGEIFDVIGVESDLRVLADLSPSEAALDVYKKHGYETPQKLNGDFNIAVYDPRESGLFIFNDRFGFRRLYVYEDEAIFIFSPEIKAFRCYTVLDTALDEQGVADYFNYSYHLGDRTMLSRVKLLPPAGGIAINKNRCKKWTYWKSRYTCERGLNDLGEAVDTGYNLFRQSMSRRMGKKKSLIIPLTGGLDSRLILAVAKELGPRITTATIGRSGCSDYQIAHQVCEALGIKDHRLVKVCPDWFHQYGHDVVHLLEAGYGVLGPVRLMGFQKQIGLNYDGLMNGIFGGHLSFGSPYFRRRHLPAIPTEQRVDSIVRGLHGYRFERILGAAVTDNLRNLALEYLKRSVETEWKRTETISDEPALRQDALFLHNRIRRGMNSLDLNRFFYNTALPFSSYELFNFYLSLRPELMLDHYLYHEIYKKKLPDLARIPWQSTGVDLYRKPSLLMNVKDEAKKYFLWYSCRISQGRVNIHDKSRDDEPDTDYRKSRKTKTWVKGILLSERCLDRGYFNKDGIERLLKEEDRGRGVFNDISKLVAFELWARDFLD